MTICYRIHEHTSGVCISFLMTCSKGKHHSESNRFRILWAFNSFFIFYFGWIKLDNWHQIKTQSLNENNGRTNNWANRLSSTKRENMEKEGKMITHIDHKSTRRQCPINTPLNHPLKQLRQRSLPPKQKRHPNRIFTPLQSSRTNGKINKL